VRRVLANSRRSRPATSPSTGATSRRSGCEPGPQFGEVLRTLLDRVIEDPHLNDRDTLVRMAGEMTRTDRLLIAGIIYSALAGLGDLAGGALVLWRAGRDRGALAVLTGFGAGFLLAVVLLGMLPHVWKDAAASSRCSSATWSCT
jgi:hypothetical protein